MALIDTLSIRFEAEAGRALTNVQGLEQSLKKLSDVVSTLSKKNVTLGIKQDTGANIRNFASAIKELDLDRLQQFGEITKGFKSIALGIGPATANNLRAFNAALAGFDVAKFAWFSATAKDFPGINVSITGATGNGLKMLADGVNTINIDKFREFANVASGFNGIRVGLGEKGGEAIWRFAMAINALDITKLREFSQIAAQMTGLKTGITQTSAINLAMFGASVNSLDLDRLRELASIDFSNLERLGVAATQIKSLSSEISKLQGAADKVDKARGSVDKLNKSLGETSGETKEAASGADKMGGALSKLVAPVKNLFKSIGRIAFYRAVRSAIKAVTQGLSEGIENLYYWSQAWGTSFAPAMDRLATATRYLRNGFASMFSPLIEYAIPIIDALVDKFVDFFNFVQEGIAQLTGAPTWNKALKVPTTYADALDDASASAKELKNQLMGFDELNVLNTPTDSGRNKAKDAEDYASMFELVETAAGDNLGGIGERLAESLNKVFEDPDAWGEKGKEIATAVTEGFDEGLDFFSGINWVNVGASVSAFISEFTSRIAKWIKDEEPLSNAITAVTDAVCGIIEGIDIIELLKSFAKVFLSLSASLPSVILASLASAIKVIGTLLKKIGLKTSGSAAIAVADKITEVRKKYDAWNSEKLGIVFDVMDNGFENYVPKDLEEEEPSELKLGIDIEPEFEGEPTTLTGIQKAFNNFFNGLKSIFVFPIVVRLVQKFQEIDWEEVKKRFEKKKIEVKMKVVEITKSLAAAWATIKEKWGEKKLSIKAKLVEIVKSISEGWATFKEKWGERVVNIKTKFNDLKTAAESAWGEIAGIWGNPELSVSTKIEYSINLLKTSLSSLWEDVKKAWGEKKLSIKAFFENIRLPHFKLTDQSGGSNYTWNLVKWVTDRNSIPMLAIDWYAQGGFINPSSYSLAGLGENGVPEILGTVGGRSAVAGGAEITGIRDAIYEQGQREETLLRNLITAVNNKDLQLVANSSTGRWINRALNAYAGVTG